MTKSHLATETGGLEQIIEVHEALDTDTPEAARLRREFIRNLSHEALEHHGERVRRFLSNEVRPEDFAALELEEPERIALLCELLYSLPLDEEGGEAAVQRHVDHLLISVLRRFEERGDLNKVFELLQLAPSPAEAEAERIRIQGRAHLYEMRTAKRRRRWLFAYLVAQAVLVTIVFPLLFISAENGSLQREIQQVVPIDLEDGSGRQTLSYADGLYWSIVTASSIGYGDITPRTRIGKFIAASLGTMGVLTVGIMAGLILYWITPRRLE